MLSAGKRSTGKGQNDGKRHANQEKENSKSDKRHPSAVGGGCWLGLVGGW
jgi:hypothetical protein